jgi:RsiW-degrading membrane proteinase PrsW (M82 family)
MTLFLFILLFIGIAAGLAWYLIFHDRGEKEPIGALWIALGFGFLGAFPTVYLESKFLHIQSVPDAGLAATLATMIGVGVIEEACKFIPLALFIYKKRYFNEHTDGVIYFALAGLGFGMPENILYTASFGTKAAMARVVLTPFFHAATTAFVGYFLIKRKLAGQSPWLVIIPVVAAMILHGLYDFGLSSGNTIFIIMSIAITFGLSSALFVLYMRAGTLDQEEGISVVGHNTFCRSCGNPNPNHYLYCVRCGKNA